MKVYLVEESDWDERSTHKAFLDKSKAEAFKDEENRKWDLWRAEVDVWRQHEKEFYAPYDTLSMFTSQLVALDEKFKSKYPFPCPKEEFVNSCKRLYVSELEVEE